MLGRGEVDKAVDRKAAVTHHSGGQENLKLKNFSSRCCFALTHDVAPGFQGSLFCFPKATWRL